MGNCCEVPLIEKLRSVPKDWRIIVANQWAGDGREIGHRFIPVGDIMYEAADEIERLRNAIRETLAENAHLADGENCTLRKLKMALPNRMS